MPFDPSRWMTQRRRHPRIGPAYQAPIPDCVQDLSRAARVPAEWLEGPCGLPNGCARRGFSTEGFPPFASSDASGGSRGSHDEGCAGSRNGGDEGHQDDESQRRSPRGAGHSVRGEGALPPFAATGTSLSRKVRGGGGASGAAGGGACQPQGAGDETGFDEGGLGTRLTGGDIEAALGGGDGDGLREGEEFDESDTHKASAFIIASRDTSQLSAWHALARAPRRAHTAAGAQATHARPQEVSACVDEVAAVASSLGSQTADVQASPPLDTSSVSSSPAHSTGFHADSMQAAGKTSLQHQAGATGETAFSDKGETNRPAVTAASAQEERGNGVGEDGGREEPLLGGRGVAALDEAVTGAAVEDADGDAGARETKRLKTHQV
ncbi:hypothetical protein BESB_066280 [Besnoitia besnoiti]|uniref:Uncharacterized protein n=1 Tax=Besnoitia besnoiti TaxID=94643 RepID=A0A2A9M9B9_BESBE|nr:hypothetical protein BESB_066280 [Besnoitia besnoiti]PFH34595.1 hypothetical protein BESB_066280 [Besnoitia besnoiti]